MLKKIDFINHLINKFDDGYYRFRDASIHLQLSYFPKLRDNLEQYLDREYGLSKQPQDILNQYYEEIDEIESYLEKIKAKFKIENEFAEAISDIITVTEGLSIKNVALNIWEFYAIPLRYRNGFVFMIHPPQSVGMPPYVESMNVELYLSLVSEKTAESKGEIFSLNSKIKFYQNVIVVLIVLLSILSLLFYWLR